MGSEKITTESGRRGVPQTTQQLASAGLHDADSRESIWLVNHAGATVLCCPILASFETGLRLRVPVGYGVAIGQRYEVLPVHPGDHSAPHSALSRPTGHWVGVIELAPDALAEDDHLEVGVVYESDEQECMSAF